MIISKTHKHYSERLNRPEVLTNPEEFLGPNFEAVLNYWLILDGLSQDQWKTIEGRFDDFYNNQLSEWDKAADEAIEASDKTIGEDFSYHAAWAALDVYYSAYWATRELIGMHKFFEQEKPLIFFNMFLEAVTPE